MKLVIHTQFRENYGAHTWDGKGECPQYWKFKGGDTFVMAIEDPNNRPNNIHEIEDLISYKDDGSEEYVLDWSFEDDDATVCEEWETPWNIYKESDGYYASRFVKAEDYWKPGFKGKAQSYLMQPCGQRAFWAEEFIPLDVKQLEPA
jgi:hypothetical protein